MTYQKPLVKKFKTVIRIINLAASIAFAVVCMRVIRRVRFRSNTSISAAPAVMDIAGRSFNDTRIYRPLNRQNLMWTMTSYCQFFTVGGTPFGFNEAAMTVFL